MIAPAPRLRLPAREGIKLRIGGAAAFLIWALSATSATAQVAAIVSLDSEARDRGYSISAGRPALTGTLSYDHPSGVYLNAAAGGAFESSGPQPLLSEANVGYAWRASPSVSLDVGVRRVDYSRHSSAARNTHYTEAYVGVAAGALVSRLSVSPDYFRVDTPTLYAEVQRSFAIGEDWSLVGHLGSLAHLGSRPDFARKLNYDWRVGLARRWQAVDLHAALSGGGPGNDYYRGAVRDRTALIVGASIAF